MKKRIISLLLAVVMVVAMLPVTVFAEGEHEHDGITFDKWTSDSELPAQSGSYYLEKDVKVEGWSVTKSINLCLNGHVIDLGGGNITVGNGVTFKLYDCNTTQVYTFSENGDGLWELDAEGTETVTGGVITGGCADEYGGAVYLSKNSTFEMHGGNIVGNASGFWGGGVYAEGNNAYPSFLMMDGGKISGNTAEEEGAGVYVGGYVSFEMTGGEISGNTTVYGNGGGVGVEGSFEMSRGSVTGNTAYNGGGVHLKSESNFVMNGGSISGNEAIYDGNGGGVYVEYDGTFTMTGGEISNNAALYGGSGGGVYVDYDGTFTMTGGTIAYNTADDTGGGVYNEEGTVTVGKTATIRGNTVGDDDNDVYFCDETVAVGKDDNRPQAGMYIGLTSDEDEVAVTGAADAKDMRYFFADADNQYIAYEDDDKLVLHTIPDGAYKINVVPDAHGTVEASHPYRREGEQVTLQPVPDAGYRLKAGTVRVNGVTDGLSGTGNGPYTFTMPDSSVNVTAEFELHTHRDANGETVSFDKVIGDLAALKDLFEKGGSGSLTADITGVDAPLTVAADKHVDLCLNGHVLDLGGKNITVAADAEFALYDCGETEHTFKDSGDTAGLWVWDDTLQDDAIKHTVTGGVITGGSADNGGAVNVNGDFTMYGGGIVGNVASIQGGGVGINSGSFTMNDGEISGNTSTDSYGGGVSNSGTMTMTGGSIIDNGAGTDGGGVSNSGTMTMTGGEIIGNMAKNNGGGVYLLDGTLTLGGKAVIKGNTKTDGTTVQNLYLDSGKTVALSKVTRPASGMSVGLSSGTVTGAKSGDEKYFFADAAGKYVKYNSGDKTLTLADLAGLKKITVDPCENGTVYAIPQVAEPGADVTLVVVPNAGYVLESLTVGGLEDKDITKVRETEYTFQMPGANVTVTARFGPMVTVNDTPYVSVKAALDAARSGDRVILYTDVTETQTVDVKKGVTLDLNGHKLTAEMSVIVWGLLKDSGTGGKLIPANLTEYGVYYPLSDPTMVGEGDRFLPVWQENGYILCSVDRFGTAWEANQPKFKFTLYADDIETILAEDSRVSVCIHLDYTLGGVDKYKEYTVNAETVAAYVDAGADTHHIYALFTGTEGITDMSGYAYFESDCGFRFRSETKTYEGLLEPN